MSCFVCGNRSSKNNYVSVTNDGKKKFPLCKKTECHEGAGRLCDSLTSECYHSSKKRIIHFECMMTSGCQFYQCKSCDSCSKNINSKFYDLRVNIPY